MPDPARQPSGSARSFASLLTSFTGARNEPDQPWDMDELGEDAATISYEQALRANLRVRPLEPLDGSPQPPPPTSSSSPEAKKALKTISVTIRVTEDEGQQLHARAKDAGLSVSAYLRSCIFEVESLRVQVKEALLQMRTAPQSPPAEPQSKSPTNWRARLLPLWHRRQA